MKLFDKLINKYLANRVNKIISLVTDKTNSLQSFKDLLYMYVNFRVSTLSNEQIKEVEEQLFTIVVKAGLRLGCKQVGVTLTDEQLNTICESFCPELADSIHKIRLSTFTKLSEKLSDEATKDNE